MSINEVCAGEVEFTATKVGIAEEYHPSRKDCRIWRVRPPEQYLPVLELGKAEIHSTTRKGGSTKVYRRTTKVSKPEVDR